MDPEAAQIRADLDRHAGLFQLDQGGLGDDALDLAVNGVKDHFDQQVDPDGVPWPALSTDYSRWKQRHYPGEPMGVLERIMRPEIDGSRAIGPDSAEWTNGQTEEGKQHATWFQEGDPEQNRPERRFADLNADSIGKSNPLFDHHFEEGTS